MESPYFCKLENFSGLEARSRHTGNGARKPKKLIDYLQTDIQNLEVEFQKFLENVEEECDDPDWAIAQHPANEILEKFHPDFCEWVEHLQHLLTLKRSGYPFDKNDLTNLEWKALFVIDQHQKEKANGNSEHSGSANNR